MNIYKKRRTVIVFISLIIFTFVIFANTSNQIVAKAEIQSKSTVIKTDLAENALKKLIVKDRASKIDYDRKQFGNDWSVTKGCDTRNIILNRDLKNSVINDKCEVVSGSLDDPYSGKII